MESSSHNDLLEQVKEIGINKSDNLLPGEKERKIIYNFMYDDKAKCYLYWVKEFVSISLKKLTYKLMKLFKRKLFLNNYK